MHVCVCVSHVSYYICIYISIIHSLEVCIFGLLLDQSSGTSRDWAKGVPKIKYVYTVELRDKGEHGFLLPPEYIRPTAEEFFASLKAVADEVKRIKEEW